MIARRRDESGFLLVGVVMFVLALTILGISLYSLSSYEASFQMQSRDSNAAFYRAQGGLDLVQALLATSPYKLENAAGAVGREYIESARAWQVDGSGTVVNSGSINWSDTVTVEVRAAVGGQAHVLRANYFPQPREDYYKRLATVVAYAHASSPGGDVNLHGQIWDGGNADGDSASIVSAANWTVPAGLPHMKRGAVNLPDLPGYFADAAHAPNAVAAAFEDPNIYHVTLDAGGLPVAYINHPKGVDSFHNIHKELDIALTGTVVLLCPHGLFVDQKTIITGSGTLVIVAPENASPDSLVDPGDQHTGIGFEGGLTVPNNVNVILSSDAQVKIDQVNNSVNSTTVTHLSVLGTSFDCTGPTVAGQSQSLAYDATTMDALIDALYGLNALPRPTGSSASIFTLLRGSWRDLTP